MLQVDVGVIIRGKSKILAQRFACENGQTLLRPISKQDAQVAMSLRAREIDVAIGRLAEAAKQAPQPVTMDTMKVAEKKITVICSPVFTGTRQCSGKVVGSRKSARIELGSLYKSTRFRHAKSWKNNRGNQYKGVDM